MYGLVLEGGGAKGSYQIGAVKAMQEMGITFSCVAGTSVGALNGAMIVQGDLEKAYETWYNITPSMVLNLSEEELNGISDKSSRVEEWSIKLKRLKKIIIEKGLDIEPLVRTVAEAVDEKRIRQSKMDFGIVTVDLTGRKPVEVYKEDIPEGKLVDYIIASASFPGFRLREIDGKLYIDGGFYNALPINLVKDKGCRDIIVIRTFGIGRKKRIDTTGLNLTQIAPSESLGPVLDFSSARARKNLQMGYYDTIRVFRKLRGSKYYVEPLNDDDFFIKYLAGLKDDQIRRISSLFGIEGGSGKRILFEYIIPKIADILGVPRNATYEDICIALIENVAESLDVERFKVYRLEELFSEVSCRYSPVKEDFRQEIPGFLRKLDLVSKIVKDKIIGSLASELFEEMKSKQQAH